MSLGKNKTKQNNKQLAVRFENLPLQPLVDTPQHLGSQDIIV